MVQRKEGRRSKTEKKKKNGREGKERELRGRWRSEEKRVKRATFLV